MSASSVIEAAATAFGAGTSLAAGVFWFRASRVEIPAFPGGGFDIGPEEFEPVRDALRLAARMNAWAAGFSTVASVAAFVAFMAHLAGAASAG